jgi:hypothetical protein
MTETFNAVLLKGTNGDGAQRGLVTIVELIDARPYGTLIYTAMYLSDGLLTPANPNPQLTPHQNCVVRQVACKSINEGWQMC